MHFNIITPIPFSVLQVNYLSAANFAWTSLYVCSLPTHEAVSPLLQLTALTKFQNTIFFLFWNNQTETEKKCFLKYRSSFHGPKLVVCVCQQFTLSLIQLWKTLKLKTLQSENSKATGWNILGSNSGRGKIVPALTYYHKILCDVVPSGTCASIHSVL